MELPTRAPERPVISFRSDPTLYMKLSQLRATFPRQTWAEVFDWLFQEDDVRAAIVRHLSADG